MKLRDILGWLPWEEHPEGGYYCPAFRSDETLAGKALPERYTSERDLYSSIYFLIMKEKPSLFHRLLTDEIWHFYAGDDLVLHQIEPNGTYIRTVMPREGDEVNFQVRVRRGNWMAAECKGKNGYTLIGCTLAPGFEFDELKMGKRSELIRSFPHLERLIKQFTQP